MKYQKALGDPATKSGAKCSLGCVAIKLSSYSITGLLKSIGSFARYSS